ncbi:MAG: hypothetical protein ACE5JP_13680 [Candidatus Bipolaricaulia bacterium]
MKSTRKPMTFAIIGVIAVLVLAGCSRGFPPELKELADGTPDRIQEIQNVVEEREARYRELKRSDDFAFYAPYAQRENWDAFFEEARNELHRSQEIFDTIIKPILDQNKAEDESKLQVELDRIERILVNAKDLTQNPNRRMTFLREVRESAPQRIGEARSHVERINTYMEELGGYLSQAQSDYQDKSEDIDQRFAPLRRTLQRETATALQVAEAEFQKHEARESADYAELGDSTQLVADHFEKIITQGEALRSKVGELYESYSKALIDMKVDYFVQIGRTSWNDRSDWSTDREYIYPLRQVNGDTWEYFDGLPEDQVLVTGSTVRVDRDRWNALRINITKSWPRGHTHAEFWIRDVFMKTYHKYKLINGTQVEETDWVEVDEEDFEDYFDSLGMTIVTKPYGHYEEERLEEATPPGMEYVGNPQYGEWRRDDEGRSFWLWYGQYAFMRTLLWGPGFYRPYYHSDWRTWHTDYRGRRPYYGTDVNNPTYGTRGSTVQNNPNYQRTDFARRGGLRSVSPSVRGAGPGSRGRGPGGGGK